MAASHGCEECGDLNSTENEGETYGDRKCFLKNLVVRVARDIGNGKSCDRCDKEQRG